MTQTNNLKLSLPEGSDKVDVGVLRTNFTALDGVLGQHAASINQALGTHGSGCRIVYGTYVGTGAYGQGAPNTLVFGFRPIYVLVCQLNQRPSEGVPFVWGSPVAQGGLTGYGTSTVTWEADRVSWYCTSANYQVNISGVQYCYFALGYEA